MGCADGNSYVFLLLLTDGEINDMRRTTDLIVEAANTLPLSIVIVGIGDRTDFQKMDTLDGDDQRADLWSRSQGQARHCAICAVLPVPASVGRRIRGVRAGGDPAAGRQLLQYEGDQAAGAAIPGGGLTDAVDCALAGRAAAWRSCVAREPAVRRGSSRHPWSEAGPVQRWPQDLLDGAWRLAAGPFWVNTASTAGSFQWHPDNTSATLPDLTPFETARVSTMAFFI